MESFALLPIWYLYTVVFLFGLIVGSFLNVVIYRFNTGVSLQGSSHCLSCGTGLRWFELVPVVSYLVLRGRCRYCSSWIPVRYLLVELLTAGLFTAAFVAGGVTAVTPVLWLLVALLVIVLVYDIYHLIIPDVLVIAVSVTAALWWLVTGADVEQLVNGSVAAALASGFYGLLWLLSHGRWIGFGDVKLALPLGFMVGVGGVFSLITLSFWVGAVISLGLLAWQRHQKGKTRPAQSATQLTMKSEVPFAPFLIVAFLLVLLAEVDVVTWFIGF